MDEEIQTGDLKWGKVESHPWWPGVVCAEPTLNLYKKSNHKGTFYNMEFLSNPPTRGWVKDRNIKDFKGTNVAACKQGGMFYSAKKSFKEALKEAEKAQPMTNKERLKYVTNGEGGSELLQNRENTTFIIGKTKIPMFWETPYVLMSTTDIPEGLTVKDSVKISTDGGKKSPQKSPKGSPKGSPKKATKSPKKQAKRARVEEKSESNEEPLKKVAKSQKKPAKTSREEEKDLSDKESKSEEEEIIKPKRGSSTKKNYEEMMDDSEDLLSDEDPWNPDGDERPSDSEEEDISSCEEEEDWSPSGKKKPQEFAKTSKRFATQKKKKKIALTKPTKQKAPPALPKLSGSLKAYLPPKLVEDQPPANAVISTPPSTTAPLKLLVIDPSNSTGPQPEFGDFFIEKSECKDGNVPYLWRYKKGGLVQKFEKMKDGGQIFYQNVLSFSDWWPCYAHKYQKVQTKVMFKYKNIEKVILLETMETDSQSGAVEDPKANKEPAKEGEASDKDSTNKDNESTNKDTSKESTQTNEGPSKTKKDTEPSKIDKAPSEAHSVPSDPDSEPSTSGSGASSSTDKDSTSIDKSAKITQEQEVSSTTPETSEFQIGQFILDKKEERNTDNFSIWKVESSILLRKYESIVKRGKLYHQPMKTYRGYKDNDIHKFYMSIKVRKVPNLSNDFVEVHEEFRPKVVVNSSMEEEYDKHPLLRHFYVYLQVFLSQALEPGFLENVQKSKEDSFIFPLGEIDKIISQKIMNVERKVRWTTKIKKAMQKSPFLREVYKPDSKKQCEAIVDSTDPVEENVFLFGPEYNTTTLVKESEKSSSCQDFKVGKNAISHISTYHKLCHFKYDLYEKCTGKIKLIRERNNEADVTDIMDACLGNKAWVLQNFEDFMQLVEIGPC